MTVEFELGGHLRPWRVRDLGRLAEWLQRLPWQPGIAPLGVTVSRTLLEPTLEAIHKAIRAETREFPGLEVFELRAEGAHDTAEDLLAQWLGVAFTDERELLRRLSGACLTPHVFVLVADHGDTHASWQNRLALLLDRCSKLPDPPSLAVLVATTSPEATASNAQLQSGWPTAAHEFSNRAGRWAGYLHERVAWHVAGNFDRAQHIGERLRESNIRLPTHERALEGVLDAHAAAAFSALADGQRQAILRNLDVIENARDLQLDPALTGAATNAVRPAPWVARALLLQVPSHPKRRYLESLQVCRPHANRLLGRCMELEQIARDMLMPSLAGIDPDSDTMGRFDYLSRHQDAIDHIIDPRGARPIADPWDVGGFGSVVKASGARRAKGDLPKYLDQLRQLRNALAHGSAAGWRATEMLDRIEMWVR